MSLDASWVRKYGPFVAVLVLLMIVSPLVSWLSPVLFHPNQLVLDMRGIEFPALYKRALRNSDGSVELTINIPASSEVLKRLHFQEQQMNQNSSQQQPNTTMVPEFTHSPQNISKTYYPLTLDSPYIINSPDVCAGVDPLHFLVIVHTAIVNFQRRRLMRETWASRNLMKSRNLRLLFVLGQTDNATLQMMIENERVVYGDLIQGRFKDTYHNLTHKGVLAYRWIWQHCPQARLILKVDDDMFVDPFRLYEVYYPKYSQANRTIACHVRPKNTSPIVRAQGKWVVHKFQFRGFKFYPFPYCNGYLVIITPDIIKAMFKAAYTTPFFWVDDVYLYGMLASKVGGVKHEAIQQNLTLHMPTGLKCFQEENCKLLGSNVWSPSSAQQFWNLSLSHISPVSKADINPVYLIR